MKRVLIISPHFPPVNAPDHQRVRMALPYLAENGWQADVVCLDADQTNSAIDQSLLKTIPREVKIHVVRSRPNTMHRLLKINSLFLRHRHGIWKKGTELLRKEKYDLVFFSTTQFPFFRYGVKWKKMFSVPFVCDYQDPWVNDYYFRKGSPSPPGGWLRYYPVWMFARYSEKKVVNYCDGLLSVSRKYLVDLKKGYGNLPAHQLVLPFGAPVKDLEYFRDTLSGEGVEKTDNVFRIVYTGRGGADLMPAIRCLFEKLELVQKEINGIELQFQFLGTSYSGSSRKPIQQLARKMNLSCPVEEHSGRIPYVETLNHMKNSDLTVVFGSTDKGYSASKLNSVLAFSKNALVVGYRDTPLIRLAEKTGTENIVLVDGNKDGDGVTVVRNIIHGAASKIDHVKLIRRIGARAMTRKMCRFFDRVVDS